jgi:hypothetical protein
MKVENAALSALRVAAATSKGKRAGWYGVVRSLVCASGRVSVRTVWTHQKRKSVKS